MLRKELEFPLQGVRGGIRKVKAVSPSPFYDGTYHPPKMSSDAA